MTLTNVHITAHSSDCSSITIHWDNDPNATHARLERGVGRPRTRLTEMDNPSRHMSFTDNVSGGPFEYTVINWNANDSGTTFGCFSTICARLFSGAFTQDNKDSFQLLFPQNAFIQHYAHAGGSILDGFWQRVHTLRPPNDDTNIQARSVSLIENEKGSLVAVARVSPPDGGTDYLISYELDPGTPDWQGPVALVAAEPNEQEPSSGPVSPPQQEIVHIVAAGEHTQPIKDLTGSPALIQDNSGRFDLAVPQGASINFYTHERGSVQDGVWTLANSFRNPQDPLLTHLSISLIQSLSGDIQAIARVAPSQADGPNLVSYFYKPGPIITAPVSTILATVDGPIKGVTGNPALTQSDKGLFVMLVPRDAFIDQYILDGHTIQDGTWRLVDTLHPPNGDTHVQVQAVWLLQSRSGKFEAVARITPPQGDDYLTSYELAGWQGPVNVVIKADDEDGL